MTRQQRLERRRRRAAVIGIAAVVLVVLASFLREDSVGGGYVIRGAFRDVSPLKPGDDVRTAGISVGRVRSIERRGSRAIVTLAVQDRGRPVHADATLTIRPRLILEGNSYVDLDPGTPAAPQLRSTGVVPESRTATSVQIDQVLDVFDLPTRGALHRAVAELGTGLQPAPPRARPRGADALRDALGDFSRMLPGVTRTAAAAGGRHPGDLRRAVRGSAGVARALADDPAALAGLVSDERRVAAALAGRPGELGAAIREFDAVARSAPPALDALDAGLPAAERLASELQPGLQRGPSSLRAAHAFLTQVVRAMRPSEVPRLVDRLAAPVAELPRLEQRLQTMTGLARPVTDCISDDLVPNLDRTVPDGALSTGDPAWLEIMHVFTGLTSFSSAVDGNGGTVRLGVTSGDQTVSTMVPLLGQILGSIPSDSGVSPPVTQRFGELPQFRPDVPCAGQRLADLRVHEAPAPRLRSAPKDGRR